MKSSRKNKLASAGPASAKKSAIAKSARRGNGAPEPARSGIRPKTESSIPPDMNFEPTSAPPAPPSIPREESETPTKQAMYPRTFSERELEEFAKKHVARWEHTPLPAPKPSARPARWRPNRGTLIALAIFVVAGALAARGVVSNRHVLRRLWVDDRPQQESQTSQFRATSAPKKEVP